MERYDLVVKGGKVYLPNGPVDGLNIGIHNTRIATLTLESITGKEEINAKGLVVIPGVIDPHMHCWRGSDFEDMGNASRAAVKGGITTLIDMPVDRPIPCTPKILKEKIDEGQSDSLVDFALYGGFGFEGLKEFPRMLEEPVVGFKIFMDNTPPIGKYPGFDTGEILDVLSMIAKTKKIASIHCEDTFIIDRLVKKMQAEGRHDPLSFAETRPPISEYAGILRTLALVEHTGCPTVIAHVSIPEGVDAVCRSRASGIPVYAETAPHYLLLTLENLTRDVRLKFKPPNRDRDRVEILWKQLQKGVLHLIGSDHAPLPKDAKLNIWEISGGVGNMVELMFPLVATEAINNRQFSLEQLVRIMCENPSRIFGLYPRKGCIQPSADADLVVLNPESAHQVHPNDLSMRVPPYSPFEGWEVSFRPEKVIIGGCLVVNEAKIENESHRGRFIPPRSES